MTKKAKLQSWAGALGADVPLDATVPQLEQAIENAIANPATPEPDCPGITDGGCPWLVDEPEYPQYTLREGLANNARVLREELPATARAVLANLRGSSK